MPSRSFYIITFGCQMNARDSQWLATILKSMGMVEADAATADVILLNTCSVREKPEHKVVSAISRLAAAAKPDARIGILGCVAQQMGEKLFAAHPAVRLVAGADGIALAPEVILRMADTPETRFGLLDFEQKYPERAFDRQDSPQAFVNIMQGCNNFCAYCIVPFTRGRQKSRQPEAILAECQARLKAGAVELTLLGQNVNAWGKDLHAQGFSDLLAQIAALPGLERLRFVTPHPADMDDETVKCFAELPNLCPRLHLPLQSGADRILKSMRRRYSSADYLRLVEKLRHFRPDLALTTDVIVGFPGESESDFQDTLDIVKECAFMASYSFCYSDRPGTAASRMEKKIDKEIASERLFRLQELQEKLTADWLASRIGQKATLLMEGKSRKGEFFWQGRDEYGNLVHVRLPHPPASIFLDVEITTAKKHTLAAVLSSPANMGG